MTEAVKSLCVILVLSALDQFQRRDLTQHGQTVIVKRGEKIKVTQAVADQLLSEDYSNPSNDEEDLTPIPWFTVVDGDDSTKVDYDFTGDDKKPESNPVTTHNTAALPVAAPLVPAEAAPAVVKQAARTQRTAKK